MKSGDKDQTGIINALNKEHKTSKKIRKKKRSE